MPNYVTLYRLKPAGLEIKEDGALTVEAFGTLALEDGAIFTVDGVNKEPALRDLARYAVSGLSDGLRMAAGQHETVTASDEVDTGLALVTAVIVSFDDDPTADPVFVSASIGDQAGAPDAGKVYIKTWKPTNVDTDITPVAATTFSKKVNWIAFGT